MITKMNHWPQQLQNSLFEWLCFNVDDCFTWHSLCLTNKFCSIKCREFSPVKKKEFSRKLYTNDGYEEETTYYLPGTGEAHGFQLATYDKKTHKTIREDWYQNGVHLGRWFTDIKIENGEIKKRTENVVAYEIENTREKMFVLRNTFIYLSFNVDTKKNQSFFVVTRRRSICGDFCEYCSKCHVFHISDLMESRKNNVVYIKNCLEKTYTFQLLSMDDYYKRLKRLQIARQVCDYAKTIKK